MPHNYTSIKKLNEWDITENEMNDWLVNERNKHQFKYVKKDNIQDHHFHTMDSINTDKSYLNVSLPNSYSSQISDKTMKKDKKLLYCLILEEQ